MQPRWIKIALWILGAITLINGLEMLFMPATWFFRIVPGVPETGPFNAHLVGDGGTFFIAVGIGLLIAATDPRRHLSAIIVAAIAGFLHAGLHVYSHEAGLLSLDHLGVEFVGIYLPTLILIVICVFLMSSARAKMTSSARAA